MIPPFDPEEKTWQESYDEKVRLLAEDKEDFSMKPGGPKAVELGCTCPILDNGHGKGAYADGERFGWWVVAGCPIHDTSEEVEPDAETR